MRSFPGGSVAGLFMRYGGLAAYSKIKSPHRNRPSIGKQVKLLKKVMSKKDFKDYWLRINDPVNTPMVNDDPSPQDLVDLNNVNLRFAGYVKENRNKKAYDKLQAMQANINTMDDADEEYGDVDDEELEQNEPEENPDDSDNVIV